ncbi:MFS transporter [Sulfoacidibacillus thermotolerans]|uniref:Major facilitator superfamily (MFS) profile domain-containing protein n=1 Tax=Sulfoacidibacillus thermotolerans TaxID=1765684 RepID=A0A2U3D7T8_SULT2|nr:MFS transporter [Sulfoacidibacillus thermotolerans]PWI57329.1 hypothetical protein BM613_08995 [Sulfoacidibacillus thermotolerans]
MPLRVVDDVQYNEHVSILNGSYANIGISIVSNFAPLFIIQALHANSQEVALLNSLPALFTIVATWLGVFWLSRTASKKWFCIRATTVARMFYGLIAIAPFFIHGPLLPLFIVLCIAFMNIPQSLSGLSWTSLIGDLIPEDRRAVFFGKRNQVITLVGMLATVVPGLILQHYAPTFIPPYQWFFILALAFSGLEIYYLILHREPQKEHSPNRASLFLRPKRRIGYLKHRPYRRFLLGSALFNLGWQMAWPLFNIYQIQFAAATAAWISAFTVAAQLSQIATFHLWGRWSARKGNTLILAFACLGMAFTPIATILSKNLVYLTGVNLVSGVFVAGVQLLLFNHLLEVAPQAERTSYIAHYNMVIAFIGFIAPEIGVWFLHLLSMQSAMVISATLRLASVILFFIAAKKTSDKQMGTITFEK